MPVDLISSFLLPSRLEVGFRKWFTFDNSMKPGSPGSGGGDLKDCSVGYTDSINYQNII